MVILVKYISLALPNSVIMFARFLVLFVYVLMLLSIRYCRGTPVSLKTQHIRLHILCAFFAFLGIMLLFFALGSIPAVDGVLLNTTYPLFIPILTVVFLKMKTPFKVWLGLLIGFIGILFVLKPTSHIFELAALLALGSGFTVAVSSLSIRLLTKDDHVYTILFYFSLITLMFSGIVLSWSWRLPSFHDGLILLSVGVAGVFSQESFTRAVYHAPSRIVSSVMYFGVVFTGLFGWICWGHIPDKYSLIGIMLVLMGSIYTLFQASRSDLSQKIINKPSQ